MILKINRMIFEHKFLHFIVFNYRRDSFINQDLLIIITWLIYFLAYILFKILHNTLALKVTNLPSNKFFIKLSFKYLYLNLR